MRHGRRVATALLHAAAAAEMDKRINTGQITCYQVPGTSKKRRTNAAAHTPRHHTPEPAELHGHATIPYATRNPYADDMSAPTRRCAGTSTHLQL